ncbi:MAG: TPM domain-containing protein [Nitrospiraceae bacterium]|nr:MAG: TPM domain-containing protein [Nitrospiraceae bacterium]
MQSKHRPLFFALPAVFLCLIAVTLFAEIAIPGRPLNHVVDLAGIINDDAEADLNRYLLELEQKTTAQFVVLTINSLEGGAIEDFSINIAHDKWKLGQKGKDNGGLLLVSLEDRKYRFETGYGLEGILPDSLSGSIGRQYLVPYFRQGDYSTGISAAVLAVINVIASDAGVEITGMPKLRMRSYPSGSPERGKPSVLNMIFVIFFFAGLVYLFIKHPRLLLFLLVMNMMGGGRRGGWGGGGGFGGGGGSFGGGGGGGFGGGGSSGSW